jgi:hypothetical protein
VASKHGVNNSPRKDTDKGKQNPDRDKAKGKSQGQGRDPGEAQGSSLATNDGPSNTRFGRAARILVLPLSPIDPPPILWLGCGRLQARTRWQNPVHPQVFDHLPVVVVSVCARVSRHRQPRLESGYGRIFHRRDHIVRCDCADGSMAQRK